MSAWTDYLDKKAQVVALEIQDAWGLLEPPLRASPTPRKETKPKRKARGRSPFSARDVTRANSAVMKAGLRPVRTVIEKATGNIVIETGKPEPVELAPDQEADDRVETAEQLRRLI